MKDNIVGLIRRPKWPRRIPMKRIHVVPRDIPFNLKRPRYKPDAMTSAKINMAPAVPPCVNNFNISAANLLKIGI